MEQRERHTVLRERWIVPQYWVTMSLAHTEVRLMTTSATLFTARRCLDVKQTGAFLGIRPRTLDNWHSQGRGPRYVRAGRWIVYRVEDLEAYLESRTVKTNNR